MKHLFLPYELSILAKEKGFNEPCMAYHRELLGSKKPLFHINSPENKCVINSELGDNKYNMVAAPLYDQIFIWLKEDHEIIIEPFTSFLSHEKYSTVYRVQKFGIKYRDLSFKKLDIAIEKALILVIK